MKKLSLGILTVAVALLALPAAASAHVVVTPSQAGVGERVLFSVSVPNERQVAVSSITLTIPMGIENVQPNVAAGWNITTAEGSGGDITDITWTGNIPVGQRADLAFKAQVPASATELDWRASQTYADGTVVSWNQKPTSSKKDADSATSGPYSVTKVADDLSAPASHTTNSTKGTVALLCSVAALVLSLGSLFLRRRRS